MQKIIGLILVVFPFSLCAQSNITFEPPKRTIAPVQFAVIGDLTGGERAGVYQGAVNALSLLQPDFILSVGDLIEGGTEELSTMNSEWETFATITQSNDIPFYPVVGNHDISNIAMREWWESSIGPRYYHFRHKDMLFLMLDA
ncbi:metallophosphoesterase family protein [Vibrio breoganii]|uniref:metallophosphoesterase family protein n=1 Tax=Vibrio breoganii TaxID=553239 RepID=UPI000CC5EB64|nr:metallophosphoesterase family protein [Vibrio breoganii]PMK50749.1 hypothetical protein BCU00_00415 [Vibrio breoganii]